MSPAAENAPRVEIRSRADLRAFLAAHHAGGVTHWLVTFRKHRPDHVPYPEVVEELLCWGWIDSLPRALDDARTMLMIAPRNRGSAWSAINKAHVERAIASGAMTAAGMAKVDASKASGMWDFLNDVEAGLLPDDLAAALAATGTRAAWDGFPVRSRAPRSNGSRPRKHRKPAPPASPMWRTQPREASVRSRSGADRTTAPIPPD